MDFKCKNAPRRIFLVLLIIVSAVRTARAQDETVHFPASRMSAGKIMAEIENQTRYKFGFETSAFDTTRMITLGRTTLSIGDALRQMAEAAEATYLMRGSVIILSPRPARPRQAMPVSEHYRPTDQQALARAWTDRPPAESQPETEMPRSQTPPATDFPAPYSAYRDPDLYTRMQKKLPLLAVKINLLYGAAALAPNLTGEIGTGRRTTLEFGGSWNRFNRIGTQQDNKKLNHWVLRPEFRWWFCERFNGLFLGAHAFYTEYNISGHKIPLLFKKQYRYEGNAYGAGITVGYHWTFARRWGVEFHAGVGAGRFKYQRYDCTLCSDVIANKTKTYFGPTRAGLSLVFLIR